MNKKYFFIILVLAILAALHPRVLPNLSAATIWMKMGAHFPGIDAAKMNRQLAASPSMLRELKYFGYELRARVGQIPNSIVILDDFPEPGASTLIGKTEVAEAFEGSKTQEVFEKVGKKLSAMISDYQQRANARIAVLIVPSRIQALGIRPTYSWLLSGDISLLGIMPYSPYVGANVIQKRFEQDLRELELPVISIIDDFEKLKLERKDLLFPRAESHWDAHTRLVAAKSIIHQAQVIFSLNQSCLQDRSTEIKYKDSFVLGDLFSMLQLPESEANYARFGTHIKSATLPKPNIDSRCPRLVYAGSSYGNMDRNQGDIAQLMEIFYKGEVLNKAVPGLSIEAQIKRAFDENALQDELVVFEFPFNRVKQIESGKNW